MRLCLYLLVRQLNFKVKYSQINGEADIILQNFNYLKYYPFKLIVLRKPKNVNVFWIKFRYGLLEKLITKRLALKAK